MFKNKKALAFILVLFAVLMPFAAWYVPTSWNFFAVMGLMFLFMITLGQRISGRPAGILINERNLMSLSRFQMVLWTMIILSAFLVAALGRLRHWGVDGIANALNIALEKDLWILLGIPTASLIGTPLIQSSKATQTPKDGEAERAAHALKSKGDGEDAGVIDANRQGVLYANKDIKDAAFSDMFEGDEVSNTAYVDLAKVQMFFFTIIAVISYGMNLHEWVASNKFWVTIDSTAFPALSAGLIAILGISHAGYLANKAASHTPTQPDAPAQPAAPAQPPV